MEITFVSCNNSNKEGEKEINLQERYYLEEDNYRAFVLNILISNLGEIFTDDGLIYQHIIIIGESECYLYDCYSIDKEYAVSLAIAVNRDKAFIDFTSEGNYEELKKDEAGNFICIANE